jgi:hypothetical protein
MAKPSGPFSWVPPPRFDARHPPPAELLADKDIATGLPLSKTAWVGAPMEYADTDDLDLLEPHKFPGVRNFPVEQERVYTPPELLNEHGFRYVPWNGM